MGLKATGRIAGWALGTMLIGQLSYLFVTWAATGATGKNDSTGSDNPGLFLFNRASDIYILPHSIVVLSIATIYFNQMSNAATSGDQIALKVAISRLLRIVGSISFFGAAALFLLSGQIGRLIGGASPEAGLSIGIAVAILALSAPFLSANFIFNRVLYATEDARTPFILQAVLSATGIAGALAVLGVRQDYLVFALLGTISAGNIISPFISGAVVHRKIGNFGMVKILQVHLKYAAGALISVLLGGAALVAAGGATFIDGTFEGFAWRTPLNAFITVAIVGLTMVVVYVLALKLLRVEEIDELLVPVVKRFTRTTTALSDADIQTASLRPTPPNGLITENQAPQISTAVPAQIGKILRGRFEITGHVHTTNEDMNIFEGTDSILMRPVNITIATARAGKTLDRCGRAAAHGNTAPQVLILDLWSASETTYLITSAAKASEISALLNIDRDEKDAS